jgi:CDP-diacylglycerol--serine O-phosphatidyltransferase
VILFMVLALLLVSSDPPIVLFTCALAYGVSGYVAWAWKRLRLGGEAKRQQDLF